jgi:hypothetical protein
MTFFSMVRKPSGNGPAAICVVDRGCISSRALGHCIESVHELQHFIDLAFIDPSGIEPAFGLNRDRDASLAAAVAFP